MRVTGGCPFTLAPEHLQRPREPVVVNMVLCQASSVRRKPECRRTGPDYRENIEVKLVRRTMLRPWTERR